MALQPGPIGPDLAAIALSSPESGRHSARVVRLAMWSNRPRRHGFQGVPTELRPDCAAAAARGGGHRIVGQVAGAVSPALFNCGHFWETAVISPGRPFRAAIGDFRSARKRRHCSQLVTELATEEISHRWRPRYGIVGAGPPQRSRHTAGSDRCALAVTPLPPPAGRCQGSRVRPRLLPAVRRTESDPARDGAPECPGQSSA